MGDTYHATLAGLHLEASQQRVLLEGLFAVDGSLGSGSLLAVESGSQVTLGLGLGGVGLSLGSSFCSLLGRLRCVGLFATNVGSSQTTVEVVEGLINFLGVVGLPKLQVGTTLQQLADTLGLLHTRHFHHDAAFLTLEGLDVGLNDAEAVDTCAEHVVRVVDGGLHLLAQHVLNLLVGALGRHLVAQLLCGEELRKRTFGRSLLVFGDEERNEVTLALGGCLLGSVYGLCEGGIGGLLVVGEGLNDVGHADLEDDIHTTLQVEAQSQSQLAALLEGPDVHVHFLVLDGIQELLSSLLAAHGCYLFGLLLVVVHHDAEAHVEEADSRKQGCNQFNKSFVLHCV